MNNIIFIYLYIYIYIYIPTTTKLLPNYYPGVDFKHATLERSCPPTGLPRARASDMLQQISSRPLPSSSSQQLIYRFYTSDQH